MKKVLLPLLLIALSLSALSQTKVLFDATKHEMAGNADWVIDADAWNNNMPAYPCSGNTNESNPGNIPTPAQAGITPSTPETYWTGGISAWAVDIVKAWGWTVESLPTGASITYGDTGNPLDLSNYDVFIICEPQNPFTTPEKTAILNFVAGGGGLFMVADHETSDRDCDGWDSPAVYNDLTGATSTADTGLFGIWFRVDGLEVKGEDWFDDGIDNNVTTDLSDPIIYGPAGSGAGGLGFFGATSMDIDPSDNPSVVAHVWRTGQEHNNLRVTFATAIYGAGRVAAIGDSSPADDQTGDPGDTLYPGWDKATGGVNNKEIHLNATYWLANPVPDTTAPVITSGPSADAKDCSADISWITDESATSHVEYGLTASYGSTTSVAGNTKNHFVTLHGLTASTTYHYRVYSSDSSANGPTYSLDATFATTAGTSPVITSGPAVTAVSGSTAKIDWQTDEHSSSDVEYGLTDTYGSSASGTGNTKSHSVTVTGLTPETEYHFRALSTDLCGNGPTYSTDSTFTTGSPALDISGWTLKQYNSTQSFVFPVGTTIPQNGYLVLGRNVTEAAFRAAWPSMPAEAVYLNSNASGSCSDGCFPLINGSETYELYDSSNALVDGMTISMATGNAYQRNNPGDDPSMAGSWTTAAQAAANPGSGAGTSSMAGVVINEMSDATPYANEFIELFNDGGSSAPDTTPPAVAITSPTSAGTYSTSAPSVSLGGTASDNLGVTQVTWVNDRGGSGTAAGTTSWTAGTVALYSGTNVLTVTAHDAASNTGTDVLTITYTPSEDSIAPAVITDLSATPVSTTSIRLDWTAPGDDGMTDTATSYEIKMSLNPIRNESEFAAAATVAPPSPLAGGTSQSLTVNSLSEGEVYFFAMKTSDEIPNTSAMSNTTWALTQAVGSGTTPVDHLLISQIRIAGSTDDFVELFNPTSSPISVNGHSLQYKSATGGLGPQSNLSNKSVPAYGWYLISYNAGTPTRDDALAGNASATAGHFFIVSNTTAISDCELDADIIDKIGYGATANCPESTYAAAPLTTGTSISRKPDDQYGNGTDTDINSADFNAPAAPDIHNSLSTPATAPPSGSSLGRVGVTVFLDREGSTTNIEWGNTPGATSYHVYIGSTPDFMTTPPAPVTTTANSYIDLTESPVFFKILAFDGTNESTELAGE